MENSRRRASFLAQRQLWLWGLSPHIFLSLRWSPAPCLSPQASGLSAGSGFSAKVGCLERNIVRNRDWRKVLIFRCLSNPRKHVGVPLSPAQAQLFGSTARGTSCESSWGREPFLTPGPAYLPPRHAAQGGAWSGGPFIPRSTARSVPGETARARSCHRLRLNPRKHPPLTVRL